MELDSRIIDGNKPLDCFDTKIAEQFIGKKGYFSDYLDTYTNISDTEEDVLQSLDEHHTEAFLATHNKWEFFLPAEWVKPEEHEKKYRPYTVMEFIKEYPLGSHLHFRPKSETMEMHRLVDGYNDCKNGAGTLFMCGVSFSMSELYDNYEIFKDGEWKPFGIKVEEKE